MQTLTPADRLIVAADFEPKDQYPRHSVMVQVLELAEALKDTGVYFKVNSALRACGYDLITRIHDLGLRVFADLKLNDIPKTMTIDAMLLREFKPDMLTVMCSSGKRGMASLKHELPGTQVLGVTVFTSFDDADSRNIFSCTVKDAACKLARLTTGTGLDGLISSPAEIEDFKKEKIENLLTFNTPGIRPAWSLVRGDDQNPERVMTPAKAIAAGAARLVIGRPITQAPDPRDAVLRTLEEIEKASA